MKTLQNTKYIKSFVELRQLPLLLTEIVFLELVLSYQLNNQKFYLSQKEIAKHLKMNGTNGVKSLIQRLTKSGFITKEQKHNAKFENGVIVGGGSSSIIEANLEKIHDIININEQPEMTVINIIKQPAVTVIDAIEEVINEPIKLEIIQPEALEIEERVTLDDYFHNLKIKNSRLVHANKLDEILAEIKEITSKEYLDELDDNTKEYYDGRLEFETSEGYQTIKIF